MDTICWLENMKGGDYLEDLGVDGLRIDVRRVGLEGLN
jgi:hypothetical protein